MMNLREIILRSIGRMSHDSVGSPDGICCYAKHYSVLPSRELPEVKASTSATRGTWATVDFGEKLREYFK